MIVFSKVEAAQYTDRGDNIPGRGAVVFARNICHKTARELGFDYFLELDDDYQCVEYKYVNNGHLPIKKTDNLDAVFDIYLDFLDNSGALAVCFLQTGDYIGGAGVFHKKTIMRKAMNAFFCRTDRPYRFVGRMNDDVSTYVTLGHKGHLFFSVGGFAINQPSTQQVKGGATEMYLEFGTYMKSFYTVMMCPSAVKISVVGSAFPRIHHKINWNACAPKILSQKWRKEHA